VIAGAGVLVTAPRAGELEKTAGKFEVEQEADAELKGTTFNHCMSI